MGAQWKQKGREIEALKRGQQVGKLVREITVAARMGGSDPETNARLAAALDKARKASVNRDTIDRALKKGSGDGGEKAEYESVVFEGFAPHKVPVVIECLTDNRNRTAPEIRRLFKSGQLGQPGSMSFFFDRLGVVEAVHSDPSRDVEADAIEAGAQNMERIEKDEGADGGSEWRFLSDPKDLAAVSNWLKLNGWQIHASEIRYVAKTPVEVAEPAHEEVVAFLNALDDHDDVHRVYTALA